MAKRGGGGGGGCNPIGCCCGCIFNCLCSCIIQILCTILVIALIVGAIIWFVFRPNNLHFAVDDAALTQFDFSAPKSTLSYNLALNMSIRNPNKRIELYFDGIEARALFSGRRFAAVDIEPFLQGTKNTTNLRAVFKGQNLLPLEDGEKSDFYQQKSEGIYQIDLRLYLKLRLKYWWIKSKKFKPTVRCDLKNVPLISNGTESSSGNFQRTNCHWLW